MASPKSTRQFQLVFHLILAFCILVMVLGATTFDFFEFEPALDLTVRYFALPVTVAMIPFSILLYLKYIIHAETKVYKKKHWIWLRTSFRVLTLVVSMSLILLGTCLSAIILTNAYLGNSKLVHVKGTIREYECRTTKGRVHHHIKVDDPHLGRTIKFEVSQPYVEGELFEKQMTIGKWGLLYSDE